jgi:pimeloyl-ACP methyl ester carboxylesterase
VYKAVQPVIRRTLAEAQIPEPTPDERRASLVAGYRECHSRLQREGIDLSAYNSMEMAADVPMVVQALGYDRYNVYAESYGTMVAQHLMRDHPLAIRSVVLSDVMPLDINVYQELPASAERVLADIFRACADDEACRGVYPNLQADFEALVQRFNAQPTRVGFRTINGDALVNGALEMIAAFGISSFPSKVRMASYGSVSDLVTRFESVPRGPDNEAFGLAASVICAEEADYTMAHLKTDSVISRAMANRRPREILEICQAWPVTKLPDYVHVAVVSDIPTLLISGEFDVLAPAHLLHRVAAGLSKSRSSKHSSGQYSYFCYRTALGFIENPSTATAAQCTTVEPAFAIVEVNPAPVVITGR